jgi:hypothetical protein
MNLPIPVQLVTPAMMMYCLATRPIHLQLAGEGKQGGEAIGRRKEKVVSQADDFPNRVKGGIDLLMTQEREN